MYLKILVQIERKHVHTIRYFYRIGYFPDSVFFGSTVQTIRLFYRTPYTVRNTRFSVSFVSYAHQDA